MLRPMLPWERGACLGQGRPGAEAVPPWWQAWFALYEGKLLADDIEQLAQPRPVDGKIGAWHRL